MSFPDLTITSLETINAFDVVSGTYKFTLDELQSVSIAQTQDKVDMTGKGGRKLNSLKRNKAVTISGANGMVSGGLLEMQTGGTFAGGTYQEESITPTFSTLSNASIYLGTISTGQSQYKIFYATCDADTEYTIKGNNTAVWSGWTKVTPANSVTVYDYSNAGGAHTFTTGADAAYIVACVSSSVTSDKVLVSKTVDIGFEVAWTDYLTVDDGGGVTTTYKAVGTVGDEITDAYVRDSDGSAGTKLTVDEYDPDTGALSFNEELSEGDEVVVFYNRRVYANRLINYSDFFSGKATLYIDALAEDKCANIYRVQFFIPKADFNGEFTFDMGDNQTIHNFEAEALAGACGTEGQLWTYTVFGVDTEDA